MEVHGPGFMPFGFHILGLVGVLVIFVAGVTALIIWAIRESTRPPVAAGTPTHMSPMPAVMPRETPLEILARRFASGEISAEEYERARDLLRGDGKT